jgi:glycosyltransferase involved in cell wall biosynthesis
VKILQVASPWFAVPPMRYGGAELIISTLVEGLVEAGHDVTLLASGGSVTSADLHTVYDRPPSADLGDVPTELQHVMAADDLGTFDVVHDHTLIGTARHAAAGTPALVHTLHQPWSNRLGPVWRRLGAHASLVAISRHQARTAPDVPIAAVIHHGLDLDRYAVSLDRSGDLVFVGRASPEKGPEQALEVARRTGRRLDMAIKVNEPDEREYWHAVLEPALRGVEAHVVFDATHEQKVAMMARAHAVLLPVQWDEPFGLVMAEAGACGTPVVAFDRGAVPEVVAHGTTGFVVPPRTGIDGLCEAVEAAGAIDPATCREHVATTFSGARMVEAHLALYERIALPRWRRPRTSTTPRETAGSPRTTSPA